MKKGILISIDGSDGSGKSTQIELLKERLIELGFDVEIISFPQYGKKSAGAIEEYLNGKYGQAEDVGPYASAIFYATDRHDAKEQINEWLAEGKIIICDRYVSANMGHQGAKIKSKDERTEFFEWLYNLEYDVFQIPKPDINIILNVNPEISFNLLKNINKKSYLTYLDKDIHEGNKNHLFLANKAYLEISEMFEDFIRIDCSPSGSLLTTEEINQKIWDNLESMLIIPQPYSPDFKALNENIPSFENILRVEKVFDNSKLPTRGYKHDAGLDLYSVDRKKIYPGERSIVRTGIKVAIPEGYVGLVWDKSGIAKNGINTMGGVIDSGFRGELTINIANVGNDIYNIEIGQKIAQLLIQKIELPIILETKLDEQTDRGEKDYGSTGLF